jgi:hypothetical protein
MDKDIEKIYVTSAKTHKNRFKELRLQRVGDANVHAYI